VTASTSVTAELAGQSAFMRLLGPHVDQARADRVTGWFEVGADHHQPDAASDPRQTASCSPPGPLRRLHNRLGLHEAPAHPATLAGTPVAEAPAVAEVPGSWAAWHG